MHTLNELRNLHPTINFRIEEEESINYLDITIHRKPNNLQLSIYRYPTQTDIYYQRAQ
jgi:hypothetical protein